MVDKSTIERNAKELEQDSEALNEAVRALVRRGAPQHIIKAISTRAAEYADHAAEMRERAGL